MHSMNVLPFVREDLIRYNILCTRRKGTLSSPILSIACDCHVRTFMSFFSSFVYLPSFFRFVLLLVSFFVSTCFF